MSDDESDTSRFYKPSFVLIAIDTHPSMFVKREGSDRCPFSECLHACYDLANSLLFTTNRRSWSPFAIALASDKSEIAHLTSFNDTIIKSIKTLQEASKESCETLRERYERKSLDLSAFLLLCQKKFKEVNSVFKNRKIVFITNDSNPVQSDAKQRFAAINEGKNFQALDILFEIVTTDDMFDYNQFYGEFFSVLKQELIENLVEDQDGLLEKLSSLIRFRVREQKMKFFPFANDTKRFLKCTQKSYIKTDKIYNNSCMSEDGKFLKKIHKSSQISLKTFCLKYGSNKLAFDAEERLTVLNTLLPKGYTLIYVSNRLTKEGSMYKNPVLLEVDPTEDLDYFNSFWQFCVDKNKVLVCIRKQRDPDKIRLVEFIPKFANNSKQFLLKTLPFGSDVTPPPTALGLEEQEEIGNFKEKCQITNDLIDCLTFDYDPTMFMNPALAKKKAFLRAKLLDEPQEEVEEAALDKRAMDETLGSIADKFVQLFQLEVEEVVGTKRKAGPASRTQKKKK